MKKIVLASLIILAATCLQAQVKDSVKTVKANKLHVAKALHLTKEQKEQFKTIHQQNKEAENAIESNTSLTKKEKKYELRKIKEQRKESIEKILNSDQKVQLADLRQKRKAQKESEKK